MFTYRTGRTLGRTVYRMVGDEASKDDVFVGLMETTELAALVVFCFNTYYANLPTISTTTIAEVFREQPTLPFES